MATSAFVAATPLLSSRASVATTSFTSPISPATATPTAPRAPTMVLRVSLRKPIGLPVSSYGGAAVILNRADEYMSSAVLYQYYNISNPTGEYGVQCTEGSVKGAAEAARVRSLNMGYRSLLSSPSKKYADLFENRKNAVSANHLCNHEEKLFSSFPKMSATYNVARNEANGACSRYATPESVEEASMMRYMDISQRSAANPSGVYRISCNDGVVKGQAEDLRVAALNVAYRNGQKPIGQILKEKYEQKKYGYSQCHGCNYEENLVSMFPAIGASFRSKTYSF